MRRFLPILAMFSLGAVLPFLLAPTGGFPYNPTFGSVTSVGNITAGSETVTGALSAGSETVTGALSAGSETVAGSNVLTLASGGNITTAPTISGNGICTGGAAPPSGCISLSSGGNFTVAPTISSSQVLTLASGGNITTAPTISGNVIVTQIACTTACNVSAIAAGGRAMIVKGTTTTITSSTTQAVDPDLQFTNLPVGVYEYVVKAIATGNGGGFAASGVTLASGGPVLNNVEYTTAPSGACNSTTAAVTSGLALASCTSGSGNFLAETSGRIAVTTSPAAIGFTWAQQTSGTPGTQVFVNSTASLVRVN